MSWQSLNEISKYFKHWVQFAFTKPSTVQSMRENTLPILIIIPQHVWSPKHLMTTAINTSILIQMDRPMSSRTSWFFHHRDRDRSGRSDSWVSSPQIIGHSKNRWRHLAEFLCDANMTEMIITAVTSHSCDDLAAKRKWRHSELDWIQSGAQCDQV